MEKLNAKNRLTLKRGDKLLTGGDAWTIVNLWQAGTRSGRIGLWITVRSLDGRTLYGSPSSDWYGAEIVRAGGDPV